MSQDSWEYAEDDDPLSLNLYTYCLNNPLAFIDPSGLDSILDYIVQRYNINGGCFSYEIDDLKVAGIIIQNRVKLNIDGKSYHVERYSIGDMVIVSSASLAYITGLDESIFTHNVGDVFGSVDDAVLAWSLTYWTRSNYERAEYAAWIYEGIDGGFFFDQPSKGDGTNVYVPDVLDGFILAGGIHTHPYHHGYFFGEDDKFSSLDYHAASGYSGVPFYVATAQGNLRKTTYDNSKKNFTDTLVFSYQKYWRQAINNLGK